MQIDPVMSSLWKRLAEILPSRLQSAISSSMPCPACPAKDPKVVHLDPMDTHNLSITLPSSGETISFTDATRTFIEDHYPDLDCTTYRVPAALFYDYKGDLDLATNEEVLLLSDVTLSSRARGSSKRAAAEVLIDRFQKDSVDKVVRCFHSWGSEHGEGMLVLSEYKMQDYLRNVKTGSKNRKKMVGDHDVMVIHLNTGVTFVQVKSVQDTSAWKTMRGKIRSAFKQVTKDEKAFRELNADLDFISMVPVVGFIALPQLTRDHLVRMGVCDRHKRQVLTKEHLESFSEFSQWVENHYSEKVQRRGTPSLGLENYKDLCGRYVGLASFVRIRTLQDAVKKTSAKVGKILLTPEQKEMIRAGKRRQIILGEYGTGKSLILAKMAEKIVATDEGVPTELDRIVFVVSCTSVQNSILVRSPSHLVEHFPNLMSPMPMSSVKIMSIADLVRDCTPDVDPYTQNLSPTTMAELTRKVILKHKPASVHFMWDEVPFISGWDWKPLEDLGKEYPETFIWLTIATGTYTFKDTDSFKHILPSNFGVSKLTKCMRMARNGFRFYQELLNYLGDKELCLESGNAVDGGIPQWYPLHDCSCVTPNAPSCTCIKDRLTQALKHVWGLLKNKIDPSSVSFVLRESKDKADRFLMGAVREACKELEIPAHDLPTSNDNSQHNVASGSKCHIVDSVSYRGCENHVVVIIGLHGWPFVWEHGGQRHCEDDILPLISRALGQIFIITLSPQESDRLAGIKNPPRKDYRHVLEHLVEKQVLIKNTLPEVKDDSRPI